MQPVLGFHHRPRVVPDELDENWPGTREPQLLRQVLDKMTIGLLALSSPRHDRLGRERRERAPKGGREKAPYGVTTNGAVNLLEPDAPVDVHATAQSHVATYHHAGTLGVGKRRMGRRSVEDREDLV